MMAKRKDEKTVPNVSGSFQIVSEEQQKDLQNVQKEHGLDEKSLYYARNFMED